MRPQTKLTYDSTTHKASDLMASAIIPLLYASKNHRILFENFLRNLGQRNPRMLELSKIYQATCKALFKLLDCRFDNASKHYTELAGRIKLAETNIKSRERELTGHMAFCKLEVQLLQKYGRDTKLSEQQWGDIEAISEKQNGLRRDLLILEKMQSELSQLSTLLASPPDEVALLFEEAELFCACPKSGDEQLEDYLKEHPDVENFLLAHQDCFSKVSNLWIQFSLENTGAKQRPTLPAYLCPFDVSATHWVSESTYRIKSPQQAAGLFQRSYSYYQTHVDILQHFPKLLHRINSIQEIFFGNRPEDIEVDTSVEELYDLDEDTSTALAERITTKGIHVVAASSGAGKENRSALNCNNP